MTIFPQCLSCRHYRPDGPGPMTCNAYPDGKGIPDAILFNKHDHKQPYAGDHGIHFEPAAGGLKDTP